ncbi:MFS transporter [Kitasatospora misakiensis]|uniref:MFS transporter n=1 Tax=Kitasatospora misakiensis TaxID=67330 RepID=A0ABW0X3B4_9ACTN
MTDLIAPGATDADGRPDPRPDPGADPGADQPLRRNKDFLRLWIGAGLSRFGSTVSMVAYPMLVLWQTGSATATGAVGFAATLPDLLVQLPAGALVDRWDRRRVMLWCDAARLLAFAAVAVAAAAWHGAVWLPLVLAAAFVEGTLGILYGTAEQAAVRSVVPVGQLPAALSQNQARGAAVGLLGHPFSGLVFTLVRWLPFALTAVLNAVAVVCLLLIRRDLRPARTEPPKRLHVDIKDGLVWLWRRRFLRIMTGVFAGSNLVFQVLGLTLMVVVKESGGSPTVLGVVSAVGGTGALLGALAAGWWSARFSLYVTAVLGHLVWLVLMPLLAVQHDAVVIAAVAAVVMFVASVFTVSGNVYMARTTPDELQGRVMGTSAFLTSGANALGSLLGGYALAHAGPAWTGLGIGAVVLLLTLTVALSPTVRAETRG